MAPRVSIVIVTWNSERHIQDCLSSVRRQTYTDCEVIVIDNGSHDGTIVHVEQHYPEAHIIRNDANQGFTKATNQGIRAARGEFILSLNPDVFLEPDVLQELVAFLSQNQDYGLVGGKVLLSERGQKTKVIDSTGLFLALSLRARDRGNLEEDHGQYEAEGPVFAACGAAVLFRRQALESVRIDKEYLDEDFFAYYDDLDVGWRMQLAGYQCGYTPRAVVYHVRGGSGLGDKFFAKTAGMQRLTLRNRYLLLLKNLSLVNFLFCFPFFFVTECGIVLYLCLKGPSVWRVYRDVKEKWKTTHRKRTLIQSKRKKGSGYIRSWIFRSP